MVQKKMNKNDENSDNVTPTSTGPANNSSKYQRNGHPSDNLVQLVFVQISRLWRQAAKFFDNIFDDFGIYDCLDQMAQHLARHPILAAGLSVGILCMVLPFIVFMIFTITTVVLTFTGFIIIEGTLITIASVLMFGFLGVIVVMFVLMGSSIIAGYFGFIHVYDMLSRRFSGGKRESTINNGTNSI